MIIYGDYIPTKKEWDYYTKIKLSWIQKIFTYLFRWSYYSKWEMYYKLKQGGTKRHELA